MQRIKIRVTVFDKQQYDGDDWPPNDALGFVKWFDEKIERIPAEFRDSACIDLRSDVYYDSPYITLDIYYYRPETNKEHDDRVAKRLRCLEAKRARDLATLAALKAKYGTP